MAISPENRAQFQAMGPAGVRADMVARNYIKTVERLSEAYEWLKEQDSKKDRRETMRFWFMVFLTTVAAVAACIAAWPVIKG
jgi:hypothetical protein